MVFPRGGDANGSISTSGRSRAPSPFRVHELEVRARAPAAFPPLERHLRANVAAIILEGGRLGWIESPRIGFPPRSVRSAHRSSNTVRRGSRRSVGGRSGMTGASPASPRATPCQRPVSVDAKSTGAGGGRGFQISLVFRAHTKNQTLRPRSGRPAPRASHPGVPAEMPAQGVQFAVDQGGRRQRGQQGGPEAQTH